MGQRFFGFRRSMSQHAREQKCSRVPEMTVKSVPQFSHGLITSPLSQVLGGQPRLLATQL
jgi:hypothetical protein